MLHLRMAMDTDTGTVMAMGTVMIIRVNSYQGI
jgi:hypothetical protein